MLTQLITLDQNGKITKGPIITKTKDAAFRHFVNRICGGLLCAEPIESEDLTDDDTAMVEVLLSAAPEGFTMEHMAEAGERNCSRKWKVYALFTKKNKTFFE